MPKANANGFRRLDAQAGGCVGDRWVDAALRQIDLDWQFPPTAVMEVIICGFRLNSFLEFSSRQPPTASRGAILDVALGTNSDSPGRDKSANRTLFDRNADRRTSQLGTSTSLSDSTRTNSFGDATL